MNDEQTIFLEELARIQDECIQITLCKESQYGNTEELLVDVTSEVIYRVMELIDGYGGKLSRCNIVSTSTGEVLNKGIELHDKCADFIVD